MTVINRRWASISFAAMIGLVGYEIIGFNTDWLPTSETNALADWRAWGIAAAAAWTCCNLVAMLRPRGGRR